jgi:RNA polymerase sigma factor (sigma-70 family)
VERERRAALNRDLARLAEGDRSAFHPVFVCLLPELERFAARHLAPEESQDAAQQALLALLSRASEFDPARDALAWALGIVAWEVRTVRRRKQRRRETSESADCVATGPSPEEDAIARDLDSSVRTALDSLSEADAEALLAFAGSGPRPSIAPATFRKRVQRAVARFRDVWRTRHADE